MAQIKDRITVLDKLYHQPYGRDSQSVECKFSHELQTVEQLYTRLIQVTEKWHLLDCGWLKENVGMLIIQNDEGSFLSVNPTDEERKKTTEKTVEVGYDHQDCWLIPPGESMRARPSQASKLSLRCQSGSAEITLYLIPK